MSKKLGMTRIRGFFDCAKISKVKIRKIIRYFAVDLQATQIAQLTSINRNTINRYFRFIRQVIAKNCEKESPFQGIEITFIFGCLLRWLFGAFWNGLSSVIWFHFDFFITPKTAKADIMRV